MYVVINFITFIYVVVLSKGVNTLVELTARILYVGEK